MLHVHHRARLRRSIVTVLCALAPAVAGGVVIPARLVAGESTVKEIATGIAEANSDFLQVPGGVRLTYRLRSIQDPATGYFSWEAGDGVVTIRWPKLFNRFRGRHKETRKIREREGEYNFETKLGAGRDAMFAQIVPYRQAWSAVHLFPLRLMFFDEADQYYVPGNVHKTDYWLPSALEQGKYSHEGQAQVDGVRCEILARSDGLDKLWVAPDRGFVVCRREIRDKKTGKIAELVRNKNLRKVAGKSWFPRIQVQEIYSQTYRITRDTGKPTYVIEVSVDSVELGNVKDAELHIVVPPKSRVEDDIAAVTYVKAGQGEAGLQQAIKLARMRLAGAVRLKRVRSTTLVLASLFGVLTFLSATICTLRFVRGFRLGSKQATAR
jgi:hypothetical protein